MFVDVIPWTAKHSERKHPRSALPRSICEELSQGHFIVREIRTGLVVVERLCIPRLGGSSRKRQPHIVNHSLFVRASQGVFAGVLNHGAVQDSVRNRSIQAHVQYRRG